MPVTLMSACLLLAGVALAAAAGAAEPDLVLLEPEAFDDLGGWDLDQQAMDQMGSPYLLAHGLGVPVEDATTRATFAQPGEWRLWVRTRDWVAPWGATGGPGRFQITLDNVPQPTVFGTTGAAWHWQDGGLVKVGREVTVGLRDLTGFEGRCDAVLFARDPNFKPPEEAAELAAWRRAVRGLPAEPEDGGSYDLVVVGGGFAGLCSALSAARQGLSVALVQDRPVLGGNSSSEVRVWPEGKTRQRPWRHIGDIVEELTPGAGAYGGNAKDKDHYADQRKMDVVLAEPRLRLLLEHHVNGVEQDGRRLTAVIAQEVRSGRRVRLSAPLFADCTGDGTVGYLAGADFEVSTQNIMGSSNLWNVIDTADPAQVIKCECKDQDALAVAIGEGRTAAPFPRCPWALDLSDKPFPGRKQEAGQWKGTGLDNLGGWFWESGFDKDQVADIELIRDNNFRAMYGAWDALKNVDGLYPNHRLNWVAFIAGKRESRRLLGDVILRGDDFRSGRQWPDACFPCSWHIDVHSPDDRYDAGLKGSEFISVATDGRGYRYEGIYWGPYRALYSRSLDNLFLAGRDISTDQEGLGPVRVMRTGGMMGEIVGKAAYLCRRYGTTPRGVYESHWPEMQELMAQHGALRRETLDGPLLAPAGRDLNEFIGSGLDPAKLGGLVVDDSEAKLIGVWSDTGSLKGYVGDGYLYSTDPAARAVFEFTVPESGEYEVRLAWQPHQNRAQHLHVTLLTADGTRAVTVDQTRPAGGEHGFGSLGRFRFEAGQAASATLVVAEAGGAVHCDALQVEKAK